jgi:hypothetical protein
MFEHESLPSFFDRMRRDHGAIIVPPTGAGMWEVSLPDEPAQAFATGTDVKRAFLNRWPEKDNPGGNRLLTENSEVG